VTICDTLTAETFVKEGVKYDGGTTATGHNPVSASDKDWPNPGDHIDAPVDEKGVVIAERAIELDDVEDLEEDEDDDSGGVTTMI